MQNTTPLPIYFPTACKRAAPCARCPCGACRSSPGSGPWRRPATAPAGNARAQTRCTPSASPRGSAPGGQPACLQKMFLTDTSKTSLLSAKLKWTLSASISTQGMRVCWIQMVNDGRPIRLQSTHVQQRLPRPSRSPFRRQTSRPASSSRHGWGPGGRGAPARRAGAARTAG